MPRTPLELIGLRDEHGATGLACPGPGQVTLARRVGEAVVAGSELGTLVRDERWFVLTVPRGFSGVIREVRVPHRWNACEHGQELVTLGPWSDAEDDAAPATAGQASEQGVVVRSPTHGTFYRRPSPDAPAFVEPGQVVRRGQTVALVEVMKCFSPIAFDPEEDLDAARVEQVLVEDGAEVHSGQPLFRMSPA